MHVESSLFITGDETVPNMCTRAKYFVGVYPRPSAITDAS